MKQVRVKQVRVKEHKMVGTNMRHKNFPFAVAALLLFFFSTFANATTYQSLSVDEIIQRTDVAFHGQVTDVSVELREGQTGMEPWTKVSFSIMDNFKGDLSEIYDLYFFGGSTEEITIEVEAMPEFRVDDEVLIFAYDAMYYSPLVGFSQGLFRLDEGSWQSESGQWLTSNEVELSLADISDGNKEEVIELLKQNFTSEITGESSQQSAQEQEEGEGQ